MPKSPPAGSPEPFASTAAPRPTLAPPGSVTVSQEAVRCAVLWGLQSADVEEVRRVTRILSECHGRLTGPMHTTIQNLIAMALDGVAKDDPIYQPWNSVLGQMLTLDMKRSR